jgi:hypothetical protein
MRQHPHAEATYRIIPFDDAAFAVEVSIPDTNPTTVSPFATESDAEAWIADHRRRVEAQTQTGRWNRRLPSPSR